MALVFWLQSNSGLTVDGHIPVWGVFLVVIAAVAAFATLKMAQSAHEKSDDERFGGVNAMLKEVRDDVKELLKHSGVER